MKIVLLDQINQNIRFFSLFVITLGLALLWSLLTLLKNLVNKQVDEKVEDFAKRAKIPKVLKDRIGIKIKWR